MNYVLSLYSHIISYKLCTYFHILLDLSPMECVIHSHLPHKLSRGLTAWGWDLQLEGDNPFTFLEVICSYFWGWEMLYICISLLSCRYILELPLYFCCSCTLIYVALNFVILMGLTLWTYLTHEMSGFTYRLGFCRPLEPGWWHTLWWKALLKYTVLISLKHSIL